MSDAAGDLCAVDHTETTRQCRACEEWFRLAPAQVGWFKQRALQLPNRCPRCREARRHAVDLGYLRPDERR